ncbi:MAG: hypothetical protein ACI8QC_001481 [Planctomycetota bacterium]|jgi:hypothetical protein
MDLNDYWQENKRFVVTVGAGALVFLIAFLFLSDSYGGAARQAMSRLQKATTELRIGRFNTAELARAEEQNEVLLEDYAALSAAVAFEPRPDFMLQEGLGSPNNQYFLRRDEVRADLAQLAGRRRISLPDGLGLEPLKTLNVDTIERHMEALDLLDRVLRCAIDAGVQQVTEVRVTLDPGFGSRTGVGRLERTRVSLRMIGDAEAMTNTLAVTQTNRYGKPLTVEQFDLKSAASKLNEVSAEVTFLVVRLSDVRVDEEQG